MTETQLDFVYGHEQRSPERVWLTQPLGGGRLRDYTWREAMDETRRMAAHLRSLDLPAGSRIAIFSKNTAWWFLADVAIWMAGHVSVPIYPTLGPETIAAILKHSGASLIFIGKLDGWATMAPGLPDELPRIAMPLGPPDVTPTWQELVARTTPLADSPRRDPDDVATIVYTSGSTGTPKGVVHSFRTMCAALTLGDAVGMRADDRAISYLPLAHVAERAALQTQNFRHGFRIYFAESLDTFVDDVRRARPTIFGSVPRLWLKFQSGVGTKMPLSRLDTLLRVPILGRVVAKKVLAGLGLDQARLGICGSAPIPPELLDWYARLGLPIYEVYGMTENFAVSHFVRPGTIADGTVGTPLPGVDQRLSDVGEILVRSPGTMLGYYQADDLTSETIRDGWLHTGDRGRVDDQGRLRITGRVKELFKTSKGKYVAPAPIETKLLAHDVIEQACVSGSGMPQPFAVVVLSPAAKSLGRQDIGHRLQAVLNAVNGTLDQHEQLDKLVVVNDEWTIDNGLLTPTLKIKRSAIEETYTPHVEGWYAARDAVVWA